MSRAQIYFTKGEVLTRDTRFAIDDATPIGAWRQDGEFFVAVRDTLTNEQHVHKSTDWGLSASQITMASIWTYGDYKRVHVHGLGEGAAGSCALKVSTGDIYFKFSPDTVTWPIDADAVLVSGYSGLQSQFHVVTYVDRFGIFVTNGIDAAFQSKDNGATWTLF